MANDIELSVGLDISDLERKVNAVQAKMNKLGRGTSDVPLAAFGANNLGSGTTQAGSNLYEFQSLKSKYAAAITEMKELMANGYEGFARMAAESAAKYKGAIDAMRASAQAESSDPFKSILKDLNSQKSQAKYGSLSTTKFDKVTEQEASIQSFASYLNRQKESGIYGSLTTTKYDVDDLADFNSYADKLNKIKSQRIDGKLDKVAFSSKADEEIFNFADKLNKVKSARKDGDLYLDTVTGKYDALDKQEDKSEVTQSEITDETKAQNKEYNEHYIKLSKLHKLLLGILAVWKSMQQVVKSVSARSAEINESAGYFSLDREGAFKSNVDKTRAMVYAGIRNMGETSPLTQSAFDNLTKKMQDVRTAALTGKGVDEQYTTAMQMLNSQFGLGMTAKELLTKGDVNLTDIAVRDIKTLEDKVIPALAKMDSIQRDQMTNYLQTVYGSDIMNAVMSNFNLRKGGADIDLLMNRVISHGENEITNVPVGKYASELADSFAELKESWKALGDVLLQDFFPAIKFLTNGLTGLVTKIRSILHFNTDVTENEEGEVIAGGLGLYDRSDYLARSALAQYANFNDVSFGHTKDEAQFKEATKGVNAKAKANEIFKRASEGKASVAEIYQAALMSTDAWQTGTLPNILESQSMDIQLKSVWDIYKAGKLSDTTLYANELQKQIGKWMGGKDFSSFSEFKAAVGESEGGGGLADFFRSFYSEGGYLDYKKGDEENMLEYITRSLTDAQKTAAISDIVKSFDVLTTGGKIIKVEPSEVHGNLMLDINLSDAKGTVVHERTTLPVMDLSKIPSLEVIKINAAGK